MSSWAAWNYRSELLDCVLEVIMAAINFTVCSAAFPVRRDILRFSEDATIPEDAIVFRSY